MTKTLGWQFVFTLAGSTASSWLRRCGQDEVPELVLHAELAGRARSTGGGGSFVLRWRYAIPLFPGYLRQGAIVYKMPPGSKSVFITTIAGRVDPTRFVTNAVADRLRASGNLPA